MESERHSTPHPTSGSRVRILIVDVPEGMINGKPKLPVARIDGKGFVVFVENPPPDIAVGKEYTAIINKLLARSGFCKVVQSGS